MKIKIQTKNWQKSDTLKIIVLIKLEIETQLYAINSLFNSVEVAAIKLIIISWSIDLVKSLSTYNNIK